MRILILCYVDYPSWKEALINGAKRLGNEVITCGPHDSNPFSFHMINTFKPDVALEHRYNWNWQEIAGALESAGTCIDGFDLILVFETNMNIDGERPQVIRGIPVVYVVTDSHRACDLHINNFHKMGADYIAYSKPYFKRIYEDWIGKDKAFFLPECTDPEIFKPVEAEENYDVIWLGSSGLKQDGTFEDPNFGENAWRGGYIKYLEQASKNNEFSFKNFGFIMKREDYVKALNSGKIVFNCGGGISPLQAQTSNRIFDAMACRRLVLTSYFVDLPYMFEEGKELVSFKSYHHWKHHYTAMFDCNEIKNIVKYYVTHEAERKEIGDNARRCIIEKYSGERNIKRLVCRCLI